MYIENVSLYQEAVKLGEELWNEYEGGRIKPGSHDNEYVTATIRRHRPNLEDWEVKTLAWESGTEMWIPLEGCPEEVRKKVEMYNELIVKCQRDPGRYAVYYCMETDGACHSTGAYSTAEEALDSVDYAEEGAYNFEVLDRKEGKWYKVQWDEEKGGRVMIRVKEDE